MFKRYFFIFFIIAYANITFSTPKYVIIVRHGEKDLEENEIPRKKVPLETKDNTKQYKHNLSRKGKQRAASLEYYFRFNDDVAQYGTPIAIFASKGKSKSMRPLETITPFAKSINMRVNSSFAAGQFKELADHIMQNKLFNGKTIIMSFEHQHIPPLAQAFGAKQAPKTWDNAVFDRTWILEFNDSNNVINFKNLPQQLLFGDSEK